MVKREITKDDIDKEVNRRLASMNFWEFCLFYDIEFFTQRPFLKEVADIFQWIYDEYIAGRPRRASVSMPPRAGKSYITSLFCAWWLAKLPKLSVMRNCCTGTLYDKFSYDVRNIIRSVQYQTVFPSVRLASDKQNLDGWNLTTAKQVSYFGAGVNGTIIGFGANLALSDDLYRGLEDALSPNYNEKVIRWKGSAHDSRMEKNCPELFIGTRWSKGDVIGIAIEEKRIHKEVKVAALNDKGETFCDAVKTTEEYQEIKKNLDDGIWEAEYMQDPIELKGLLFPKSKLQFYNPSIIKPEMVTYRFAFIDPANEGGDDLSTPVGYLIGNKIYVHDVMYNNLGTDVNEPATVELLKMHKCDEAEIEGNSAWYLFANAVKTAMGEDNSDCNVRTLKNTANKHVRIYAQSAFIKNHFIFRSDWEQHEEYRKFMKCLTRYMVMGKGAGQAHDDAPDSLAGMAKHFRSRFPELWKVVLRKGEDDAIEENDSDESEDDE